MTLSPPFCSSMRTKTGGSFCRVNSRSSLGSTTPEIMSVKFRFHDTRDYVRQILAQQIELTSQKEQYVPIFNLPREYDYFRYQGRVNHNLDAVASHTAVAQHQQKYRVDYRAEALPNPVPGLSDKTRDNTQIARMP